MAGQTFLTGVWILLSLLLRFASSIPAAAGSSFVPNHAISSLEQRASGRDDAASFAKLLEKNQQQFQSPFAAQCPRTTVATTKLSSAAVPIIATQQILPLTYMVLLSLQFAVQPVITQKFAPKTMVRSTYVLAQDLTRVAMTALLLTASGSWTSVLQNWSWKAAVLTAGVPSILYLVQNYCSLMAYQNLPPITYNVLNQTKTLSAAFWCYLLMRQRQSVPQMAALGILLLSALVMENIVQIPFLSGKSEGEQKESSSAAVSTESSKNDKAATADRRNYVLSGLVPIMAASLISGLAGAWIQRSLQMVSGRNNNSLFLTLQMSVVSATFLLTSLLTVSPDRQKALDAGSWTTGWTIKTWIPIIVNATGGVLVGLVTKFSGVVPKGFALIVGMFLSGILQNIFTSNHKRVSGQQWIGGLLAAISVYLHSAYPASR